MSELPAPPVQSLGLAARRPAVAVALLFTLGIWLHDRLPLHPNAFLAASAIFTLLAGLFISGKRLASVLLGCVVILLGIGITQREHFQFSSNDISLFATDEPHLTELAVRLLDDPQIITGPATEQRSLPPKQVVTAQVLQIKTWAGWTAITGQLPIQIDQIDPSLQAGQAVQILGMLQRPRAAMNPGEFDWAAYYRHQRIMANFTVTRAGNIHILSSSGPSCLNWLRSKARHALADGFTVGHAPDYAILDALVLGDRDPALRDIEDEFQSTGTGYQLSVGGLHIAVLAAVVFWFCRWSLLSPRVTLTITTCFVLLYAAVSLPSHSGVRSAILCVFAAIAICSGRSFDRAQVLSLAAVAVLIWHPLDLYSAGFHLSFAVVIVFLLLLPGLRQWLRSFRDPDDLARPSSNQSPLKQLGERTGAWILRGVQYSLLAWLATLPLVAYHFGQASSWSILGGLLLLPLVIAALIAGVLKILFTLLWSRLSGIFAAVTSWPIEWVEWSLHQLAKLPGSSIALPAPPIWLIVVYYLLLLAPLLSWRRRWILRLAPLVGVLTIFSFTLYPRAVPSRTDQLKLTLLSLGAGQCAVVEPPGGLPVLFDAGSTTVSDVARKIVEPFLRAEGESQVNEIFLSHGDFDHISAAGEITAAYGVRQVFTSYHFVKNAAGNVPDQILLEELEKLDRSPTDIAVGDHFDLGNGSAVDVLWPPKAGDLNSNNAGLVLRLTYAGRSILFPADIQDPGFEGVLRNPAALRSDVLVAAHHGSSEDLTPAFLAAVHPQIILSSNFGRLTSKQRRFETMTGHTPLYRTPECGAITVIISKDGKITVTTFVKGAKPKQ